MDKEITQIVDLKNEYEKFNKVFFKLEVINDDLIIGNEKLKLII